MTAGINATFSTLKSAVPEHAQGREILQICCEASAENSNALLFAIAGDWKRMPEFDRLLIFRTLRPDRLTAAMARFVANTLGEQYITSQPFDLERSFQARLVLRQCFPGCCAC